MGEFYQQFHHNEQFIASREFFSVKFLQAVIKDLLPKLHITGGP
jgi:hypothetical protein